MALDFTLFASGLTRPGKVIAGPSGRLFLGDSSGTNVAFRELFEDGTVANIGANTFAAPTTGLLSADGLSLYVFNNGSTIATATIDKLVLATDTKTTHYTPAASFGAYFAPYGGTIRPGTSELWGSRFAEWVHVFDIAAGTWTNYYDVDIINYPYLTGGGWDTDKLYIAGASWAYEWNPTTLTPTLLVNFSSTIPSASGIIDSCVYDGRIYCANDTGVNTTQVVSCALDGSTPQVEWGLLGVDAGHISAVGNRLFLSDAAGGSIYVYEFPSAALDVPTLTVDGLKVPFRDIARAVRRR